MKRSIKLFIAGSLGFSILLPLSGCSCSHELKEVIIKKPTCLEAGTACYECSVCGSRTPEFEIPALGHKEKLITYLPTCTEKGFTSHVCGRCGIHFEDTDFVDPIGHDYQIKIDEPGCEREGLYQERCTRCGDFKDKHAIEATGHNYVSEVTEPTCHSRGFTTHTCTKCHDTYKDTWTDPIEHSFELENHLATCTCEGYTKYHCKECGYEYEDEFVDMIPHKYETTVIQPTCSSLGYTLHKCSECGKEYITDYKESLPHNFEIIEIKTSSCVSEGYTVKRCSVCGLEILEDYEPMNNNHDFVDVEVAPTCINTGYTLRSCKICGYSYKTNETEALTHDIIHHEGKPATALEVGYEVYDTCSRCDYSTYQAIPALECNHSYKEVIHEPTTDRKGYTEHTCTLCGYSFISDEVESAPANRVYSANETVRLEKHSDVIQASKCNDDTYFYVFYLGRVEDTVLHKYVDFKWSEGMEALKSYPKPNEIREAKAVGIESTLENNLTILGGFDIMKVLSSESIQISEYKNLQTDTYDNDLGTLFRDTYDADPLEYVPNSYNSLTNSVNNLRKDKPFEIEIDKYEYGNTYSYCAVTDLDIYLAAAYDISTKQMYYKRLSLPVGEVNEKLFISSNESFDKPTNSIPLDEVSPFTVSKPSNYVTNHPRLTFTLTAPNCEVGSLNGYKPGSLFDFKHYYDLGYDKMIVSWTFTYSRNKNAQLHFMGVYCYNSDAGWPVENGNSKSLLDTTTPGTYTGSTKDYQTALNTLDFASHGGICLYFSNENWIASYFISDITITLELYCSRATY